MTDYTGNAYNAASRAAHELVGLVGEGLFLQIQAGVVTDAESLSDALHEAVDGALTYTVTQWVCAWGLPDCDEGWSDGSENFDKALAIKAYENLMGAVNNQFGSRFQEMLQVAADKQEEAGS